MHRLLPIAALAVLPVLPTALRGEPRVPFAPERELASLVPERCSIFVEASGLLSLFEQGLEHPFLRTLRRSELVQAWLEDVSSSPEDALTRADAWLSAPVLDAAAGLSQRGLVLGYDAETQKSLLVALGSDSAEVERRLQQVLDAIERQFGWAGGLDQPHARWSDAEVWTLGEAFLARRDALLVLGNDEELVRDALELAADPDGRGLLDRPGFVAQQAARPTGATLWAWLDMASLEPFADEGFREMRSANRLPSVHGLLGARIGALLSSSVLSVALSLRDERVLELCLRSGDAPGVAALTPSAREGDVPAELSGERLAHALLYRDYGRFLTLRSELFAAETLPQFAEAITNGALFFEGQDIGEEVLSRVSPWIRLEVRELVFADERRPEIPLPGMAAVAVLDDERAGEQWIAAFQTLVSVLNVDQAQKGGRSFRLQLLREGEIEISAARYATPGPNDGVDMLYNLEPALAVVGRHLVIGTHESLVRELVRELAGAVPGAPTRSSETLELAGAGWRAAFARNYEVLVAQEMLEDGRGRDAAEKEIQGLLLALAAVESVRVELGGESPTTPELSIELRLAETAARPETGR